MKIIKIIGSGFFVYLLFLFSCSSLTLSTDYDKTADFTKYKTYSYYGWAADSDKILNQLDKNRIESAFKDEFTKRGMTLSQKDTGDVIVVLYIVTQQKQETTATTYGMGGGYGGYGYGGYMGYGPGYGGSMGMGMATTNYNTYDYTEGTLIVDVYDTVEKKLVFEAVGKGTVSEKASNRDKNTPKTVSAMMKDYPIKPIATK